MTRKEKYPNTSTFTFYNANPKNKYTDDCIVRALCTAMEKPYEDVLRDLCELSIKTGKFLDYDKYLQLNGWTKFSQPRKRDNTKYTGKEFCKKVQNVITRDEVISFSHLYNCNNIIANIGGHHIVAIINGKVQDIWDSTDGSIGNMWIKRK